MREAGVPFCRKIRLTATSLNKSAVDKKKMSVYNDKLNDQIIFMGNRLKLSWENHNLVAQARFSIPISDRRSESR